MMMLSKLLFALFAVLASAELAPQPAGWPQFQYKGVITKNMKYNLTGEYIFPSMFHAGKYLKKPLATWYLFYAPHENPGGISLSYSNSLDGPWTEYANNPVISNKTPDYSVPHVSSPDAKWNDEAKALFVYFHGDNTMTRWAESTSDDGLSFKYGGIALRNSQVSSVATETSYARVTRHPNTSSKYKWAMVFMSNERDNVRKIRLAESIDGRNWVSYPRILVNPGPDEGTNVSGPDLWLWKGNYYLIYHANTGQALARPIDKTLRNLGDPILLHQASGRGDDVGRVASPQVVGQKNDNYLFYESGARLDASIAWAKAV